MAPVDIKLQGAQVGGFDDSFGSLFGVVLVTARPGSRCLGTFVNREDELLHAHALHTPEAPGRIRWPEIPLAT